MWRGAATYVPAGLLSAPGAGTGGLSGLSFERGLPAHGVLRWGPEPALLVFTCSLLPGTPQPCPPRAPALHPQCTVSWGLPGWSWASGPGRLGTRCLQLSRSVSGAALKEPACSLHRFFRTEGVSGSRLRGPGTTPALSRPQRPSREFTALQEGLRDSMALANVE